MTNTTTGRADAQLTRDAGTVLHAGFAGTSAPDWMLRRLSDGGLGGAVLFRRNIVDPEQVTALTAALRAANPDVLVAIDEESGDVTRLEIARGSSYPGNLALGAVDDPRLTEAIARSVGRDLSALGVNLDYAPVADVNVNPENPVIGVRAFGAEGPLVSRHTAAFVRGLQAAGVAACAKHFPGHGDSRGDSHVGLPLIELDDAAETVHLAPFRAAVEAGALAIMTAHVLFPRYNRAVPATMAPEVLTGLLRGRLGFEGLVVTDGIDMGAISATYGVAEGTVKAIAAGADAICWGGSDAGEEEFLYLRNALIWAVREGRLSEQRLHEAAERNRSVGRWSADRRAVLAATSTTNSTTNSTGGSVGASSGASVGAADAALSGHELGLAAARRAVWVRGELKPFSGLPHVVEFVPVLSFAIDPGTAWGVAGPLADALPGVTVERIEAPTARIEMVGFMRNRLIDDYAVIDVRPTLDRAVGRPLVVVARGLGQNPWMAAAVRRLLTDRPDAVLVEMGLPSSLSEQFAAEGFTVLITHGAARVCAAAAAELLTARPAPEAPGE